MYTGHRIKPNQNMMSYHIMGFSLLTNGCYVFNLAVASCAENLTPSDGGAAVMGLFPAAFLLTIQ